MPQILIITGEVSGDLYGGMLATALKAQDPSLVIHGVGGDALRKASHQFVAETAYSHSVGLKGIFTGWRHTRQLCQCLQKAAQATPFDQVILIDFQHANFAIARLFNALKIPITTFITPNFWIWKDVKSAQKIAGYSHKIITIFEKEYELYKPLHPRVFYFGHPMVDVVQAAKQSTALLEPKKPTHSLKLGLLPGSRRQEIDLLLTKMLYTATYLKAELPKLTVQILVSHPRFKPQIQRKLAQFPELKVTLVEKNKSQAFQKLDFLLCASGSATLEAILYQVPMGIFCALPPLTYWAAKYLLRLKLAQVSLPNIMVGKHQVPEWVQGEIHPGTIAREVKAWMTSETPQSWSKRYAPIIRSMTRTSSPITHSAQEILTAPR